MLPALADGVSVFTHIVTLCIVAYQLRETQNAIQWGAQLVRHIRHKVALHAAVFLGLTACVFALAERRLHAVSHFVE